MTIRYILRNLISMIGVIILAPSHEVRATKDLFKAKDSHYRWVKLE